MNRKLTNEEAIERIKDVQVIIRTQHMCRSMDDGCTAEEVEVYKQRFEALKLAIKVLKKQTPQKVVKIKLRKGEWGVPWRCPECDADITKVEFMRTDGSEPAEKVSYCWYCGQAIDWSEKHEP